jgi:aspartate ammonia-lyase
VEGLEANEARCRAQVENATASATALLPLLGYERTGQLVAEAEHSNRGLKATALALGWVSAEQFDQLTSSEAVCRLGSPVAGA